MRKAFDLLKHNYMEAEDEKKRNNEADQFSRLWFKKRFFSIWIEKFEDKVDMKSIHLVFKARVHHEQRIIKDSFRIWRGFYQDTLLDKVSYFRSKIISL